ncbi:hypothetical protein [Roseibium salinum]|uniref:Uncharacterized protein n=1 Tax=Roseibium salinum TaxID=1604349 RepID=A0ABT3QWI1_9HYPH|nr:hypothetical protein [Roseibium sp. DSM 29163]MCX2721284.1 hypothetical protein [Roseibium sp. DSM 29163]
MTKGGKDDRKQEKADGKPQPQESDAPVPDSGDHGTDQYETFLDQAKELDDAAAENRFQSVLRRILPVRRKPRK